MSLGLSLLQVQLMNSALALCLAKLSEVATLWSLAPACQRARHLRHSKPTCTQVYYDYMCKCQHTPNFAGDSDTW